MKKRIVMSLLALTLASTNVFAETKVVYGDDNRVDVYASDDAMFVELAMSTAAMISKNSLMASSANGEVAIEGGSLRDRGMCEDEPFVNQKVAANCSGFLVGENLLVTAGHCIKNQSSCDTYSWVFDYRVDDVDQFEVSVPTSSVYNCKRIISRALDGYGGDKNDYALIELDRSVNDRNVLQVRTSGSVSEGDPLVVIGHPTGLPTKIADGAWVRGIENKFFYANLDTYGGNSGSAVFNSETGVVEGILVRGARDYVYSNGCYRTNYISNTYGTGEGVTKITNIAELQ